MSPSPYDREWIVWHPEGGEDGPDYGLTFMASSAMQAAEDWADAYDQSDDAYTIVKGEPEIVHVCEKGQTNTTRFKVSGRIIRRYCAEKIQPPQGAEVAP